jgi:hypothetical protein
MSTSSAQSAANNLPGILKSAITQVWGFDLALAFAAHADRDRAVLMAEDATTLVPGSDARTMFIPLFTQARKHARSEMTAENAASWLCAEVLTPERVKALYKWVTLARAAKVTDPENADRDAVWSYDDDMDEFGRKAEARWNEMAMQVERETAEFHVAKKGESNDHAVLPSEVSVDTYEDATRQPEAPLRVPTCESLPVWFLRAAQEAGIADAEPWTSWSWRTIVGIRGAGVGITPESEEHVVAVIASEIRGAKERGEVPVEDDLFGWLRDRIQRATISS